MKYVFVCLIGIMFFGFQNFNPGFCVDNYSMAVPDYKSQKHYNLTNALPRGYKKDGSEDYTAYLQDALNRHKNVLMPDFTVSTTGLSVTSDSHIKFQRNSKLKLIPTDRERYQVLAIHGVENVLISDANIEGDLKEHKGSTGEWGFGIDIRNSKNVTIKNAKVSNCWGDGIVVAYSSKGFFGKKSYKTADIVISGFDISYCRRNGITVGGVENLDITNGVISYVRGTAPEAAIMIEPDRTQYILKKISITNVSVNNSKMGIATNLGRYVSENENRNFDLLIDNFTSKNNGYGVYFAGFKSLERKKAMRGNVKVRSVKIENTRVPFQHRDKYSLFPPIRISNFTIDGKQVGDFKRMLRSSYEKNIHIEK